MFEYQNTFFSYTIKHLNFIKLENSSRLIKSFIFLQSSIKSLLKFIKTDFNNNLIKYKVVNDNVYH